MFSNTTVVFSGNVLRVVPTVKTWLLFGLFLAGSCGGGTSDRAARTAAQSSEFRVALLTPGPISDKAWNGSAYAGLQRIRDSLAATISHIQVRTPSDFDENFRQYGVAGYSLVIGHGFEFQEAAARAAVSYPATVFATTGGETIRTNLAALSFAFDEPSFLAGMAAGALSQSGVIAAIGGTELPPVKSSFSAFAAGARTINPQIRVITTYLGNWDDMSAGKEQAIALVARGADVIFQNADAAGLGVFQAAREGRGVLVVGANANQTALAPDAVIGSVVIDVPHAFLLLAREVKSGTFTARVIRLGTRDDVVRWEPNPLVEQRLSPRHRVLIDSVSAQMRAGTFSIPRPVSP